MSTTLDFPSATAEDIRSSTVGAVTFFYTAPREHTLEMCASPNYWQACAEQIRGRWVNDSRVRIEILAADGTWEAELRVLSVSGSHVETRIIREWHSGNNGQGHLPPLIEGASYVHVEGAAQCPRCEAPTQACCGKSSPLGGQDQSQSEWRRTRRQRRLRRRRALQ